MAKPTRISPELFDQIAGHLDKDPQAVRRRVVAIERLMERSMTIPGTNHPVGLDFLLNFIPVVGSFIVAFSELIVTNAWRKVFGYLVPPEWLGEGLYQALSTEFFYVLPEGLAQADEVPEDCGVLFAGPSGLRLARPSPLRAAQLGISEWMAIARRGAEFLDAAHEDQAMLGDGG